MLSNFVEKIVNSLYNYLNITKLKNKEVLSCRNIIKMMIEITKNDT